MASCLRVGQLSFEMVYLPTRPAQNLSIFFSSQNPSMVALARHLPLRTAAPPKTPMRELDVRVASRGHAPGRVLAVRYFADTSADDLMVVRGFQAFSQGTRFVALVCAGKKGLVRGH